MELHAANRSILHQIMRSFILHHICMEIGCIASVLLEFNVYDSFSWIISASCQWAVRPAAVFENCSRSLGKVLECPWISYLKYIGLREWWFGWLQSCPEFQKESKSLSFQLYMYILLLNHFTFLYFTCFCLCVYLFSLRATISYKVIVIVSFREYLTAVDDILSICYNLIVVIWWWFNDIMGQA